MLIQPESKLRRKKRHSLTFSSAQASVTSSRFGREGHFVSRFGGVYGGLE